MKDTVEGYEEFYRGKNKKRDIIYSRMDKTMIERLHKVRAITGISTSEIIRESVRRLLADIDETGVMRLDIK